MPDNELSDAAEDEAPSRCAIAAHQAGHAVAAWALGRPVGRMWIDRGGGTDIADWDELSLTDQVALWVAGACGMDLLEIFAPSWIARKDQKKVMCEILAGLPDGEQENHITRGHDRAYAILSANRTLLKVLVETLRRTDNLDGAAFSKLTNEYGAKRFLQLVDPGAGVPAD